VELLQELIATLHFCQGSGVKIKRLAVEDYFFGLF
jgi:hypothetical protein